MNLSINDIKFVECVSQPFGPKSQVLLESVNQSSNLHTEAFSV